MIVSVRLPKIWNTSRPSTERRTKTSERREGRRSLGCGLSQSLYLKEKKIKEVKRLYSSWWNRGRGLFWMSCFRKVSKMNNIF